MQEIENQNNEENQVEPQVQKNTAEVKTEETIRSHAPIDAKAIMEKMQSSQAKAEQKKRDRGPTGLYPGRRKTSIAQVKVVKGSGKIFINKRPLEKYFTTARYQSIVKAPLILLGQEAELDVFVNVKGGGITGQADAIAHGLARSLDYNFPESHQKLRKAGLLTRDSRMVERKKYGLHKARRAPQFSKR